MDILDCYNDDYNFNMIIMEEEVEEYYINNIFEKSYTSIIDYYHNNCKPVLEKMNDDITKQLNTEYYINEIKESYCDKMEREKAGQLNSIECKINVLLENASYLILHCENKDIQIMAIANPDILPIITECYERYLKEKE